MPTKAVLEARLAELEASVADLEAANEELEAALDLAESELYPGRLERAVRADLSGWGIEPSAAKPALAVTLARALDNDAGMATAAIARELRAVLDDLAPKADDDDDHAELVAGLSTPVVDTTH